MGRTSIKWGETLFDRVTKVSPVSSPLPGEIIGLICRHRLQKETSRDPIEINRDISRIRAFCKSVKGKREGVGAVFAVETTVASTESVGWVAL